MGKKGKIYISDEGFGHIVRQNAIFDELSRKIENLEVTIQTEKHLEIAKKIFTDCQFISKHSNIVWDKNDSGSPHIEKIKQYYTDYIQRSEKYILSEEGGVEADFIVSDFVYEAFPIGEKLRVPTFGVAHFTWDWFFSKLYPPVINSDVMERFFYHANKADVLFFPPLTPVEILKHYKNSLEVPFIVRKNVSPKTITENNDRFKVLIIDSGAGVLKKAIEKSVQTLEKIKDVQFYLVEGFDVQAENITYIPKEDLLVDYIGGMDLVIGRAGFNTISECIAYRTPMLLLGEAMNPEMSENIIGLKKMGLGSFMSLLEFETSLDSFLPRFINSEYKIISENMRNHEFQTNGAEVVAEEILNRL